MDVWDDSQQNGPERDAWKRRPPEELLGYVEPSKAELLSGTAVSRQRRWKILLNDSVSSNTVWWSRLMRFMEGR